MTGRARQSWPDVARGLCMVLVVLWHVVTKHVVAIDGGAGVSALWVTATAQLLPLRIPLFFLVSGMFAARAVFAPEAMTVRERAARLSALYVLWLVIQTFALAINPTFDTARATTIGEFLAQLTISPTNLWYLLALAGYLLLGRGTRLLPTSLVLGGAFLLSAVAATGVIPASGNLWQVFQNLFFFLAGLRLRAQLERFARASRMWRLLGLGAVAAGAVWSVSLLGARAWFGVWPVLCIIVVLFAVVACVLADRHLPFVSRPLGSIGRRTLPIYVIHMIPLAAIDQVLRSSGAVDVLTGPVAALLEPLLLTAVVIACCLAVHAVLLRLRLGVLFDPLLLRGVRVRSGRRP